MQAITFTQKLLRQRRFLNPLIPLLALFVGLGTPQTAQAQVTQYDNAITLTQQPTGATTQSVSYAGLKTDSPYTTYPSLGNSAATTPVPTPALGTYDLNKTSQLIITGGAIAVANSRGGATAASAQLLYRVYLSSSTSSQIPSFSQLDLPFTGYDTFGDRVYKTTTAKIDLLSGLVNGGNYTIDVRFQVTLSDGTTNTDPSGNYTLAFYVTPPLVTPTGGTTNWISTSTSATVDPTKTDWTNPANWDNGVPTATSNAVIPEKVQGYYVVYPILNNPNQTYAVKNLTLKGTTNSSKAELTIENATLTIYGDLSQVAGGLRGVTTGAPGVVDATKNSTIIFAGANQQITGRLSVPDVIIAGTGIKSVLNALLPTNTLSFQPTSAKNGVLLQSASNSLDSNGVPITNFDTTGNSLIDLAGTGLIVSSNGMETTTSYVKGVLRANRPLVVGTIENFGNLGLDMTPNHSLATDLIVFRIVGDALTGPLATGAVPIKRQYQVSGDVDSRTTTYAGASSTVVFHYLPSADELNGIKENNLTMFRTTTNGVPYQPLGGVLDLRTNTVTKTDLTSLSLYTLTLGDKTNPLPVTLTAFDVKRVGTDAVVTWQTATEKDSKGYEVQVSTDGQVFRTLTFVPSEAPNSVQVLNYSYTDVEQNKAGVRYYRLRQVDLDGKATFFAPRSVSFSGRAGASSLAAYPNPFTSGDQLRLTVQSLSAGKGMLRISDMTGRIVVRQQAVEVSLGDNEVVVAGINDLKTGIYIVNFTLPSGEVKNLKVLKQ
ncbi:MAG: hypothetical protein NVS3B25_14040 [Hymenobacter sp.]